MSDFDYIIRVMVPDMSELERFVIEKVSRLEGVDKVKTDIVLKERHHKTALPVHHCSPAFSRRPGTAQRAAV